MSVRTYVFIIDQWYLAEQPQNNIYSPRDRQSGWFTRKILRKTSSTQSMRLKPERQLKRKRSISDLSLRLKTKKDKLKDKDLQELVRICGSSLLYLPAEYAVGSLSVPTCFRATAQYLIQHGWYSCVLVFHLYAD